MSGWKVLGFTAEDGWTLRGCHPTLAAARVASAEDRRSFTYTAIVLVRDPAHNPHIAVEETDCPRPERLVRVAEFRRVATAY